MEQSESNKDKQELMERIKDKYCLDRNVYKWVFIILGILVIVYAISTLVKDKQITASGVFFVYWSLWMMLLWRRGVAMLHITDAKDLLSCYDKYERISWVCFALLIILTLLIDFDYLLGACLAVFIVILILALRRFGWLQDENIKRLKELVKEEK